MDASRYFFQQLSGRFFRIVLLVFFLVIGLTSLLVLRDNQVTLLAGQELPLLTKESKRQQKILSTYLALENLTQRTDADNLAEDYELAHQQINEISLLMNNKSQLDLMFVGHKEFSGIIGKLDKKHDRNNQLKQSTIIQLQLINDQLTIDIKDKQRQKALLFQQINSDRFTDKVTATRVKAYATQITELSNLKPLQQTVIRSLLAFQQLNLQYSIVEFDDVSAELKQVLTGYLLEEGAKTKGGSLLTAQLITLEQLLFSQQNSVAKWRSHLRLTRLYVDFIRQQQQKLQQLVLDASSEIPTLADKKLILIDWVPVEIKKLFNQQKIMLNNQHLQLTILGFIALLFFLLLNLIFKTKKKIKNYGQESVQLLTGFIESLTKGSDEKFSLDQLNSTENIKIAEQVEKALNLIIKPEHSETEYQQQLEEQQTINEEMQLKKDEIKRLITCVEQLELSASEQNLQHQSQDSANNEKLSNMIVRTMLQSQSASIGTGVTSQQVYRQLARIFDWCRQSKVRSELLSNVQAMTLSDVDLHNEIDTALLNIITDTHSQRNKIYYQQDGQLLAQAKLDISIFHQLLNGVSRLLLTDLFKADLQINSTVMDKNEGQQIVRFDFSVATNQKIVKLPEEIERLLQVLPPVTAKINSGDTVDYLCLLLDSLNVIDKNVQLQEKGYQFSFTLPIAFADITQRITLNEIDLQQANILLLTDDNNIRCTVQKAISSANGLIESFVKPELLVEQLNANKLMTKKVEMVILGSDFYVKSLDELQQHIITLSKCTQPKLLILQPYFNAHLARHGLFDQAANPLKISSLQQSICSLLTTDKSTNIKFNANTFTEHQYLATQVEVLFAVEDPVKHLSLLRILQWLGLQVKIVCQPKELLRFWSSGRYLLLFTEFEQSPFIEMAAGKDVRRDIFTFDQSCFPIAGDQKAAEKWVVSVVPTLNDIDSLVTLLQPWLKAKPTKVLSIDKLTEQTNEVKDPENINTQVLKTIEKIDDILSTVNLAHTTPTDQPEAFNLEVYAQNQGSTELAIVMLDDYIDDIDQAMNKLSTAVKAQNYRQGVNLVNSLIKTSTILAAQDFTDVCQRLLLDFNRVEVIEHQDVVVLFDELSHQQRLLSQYAEAI